MKIPPYRQTAPGIMFILQLFTQHQLSYLLFKGEHIFAGENKNLDILLETDKDYESAARLLEEQGLAVRLSEKVEKYKTMYTGFYQGTPYSIHLHRQIAWQGMSALNKQSVFQRARLVHPLIKIPRLEDSILIHAAHVLLENFTVTVKEADYLSQAYAPGIDKKYILQQLQQQHWRYGFRAVLRHKAGTSLSKTVIAQAWMRKLLYEPATAFYLARKIGKKMYRALIPRRRGCLIALSGINGSGKSTLVRNLLAIYRPLTDHLGKNSHYYYYGWEPEFFLTKMASAVFKKRNKKVFPELNLGSSPVPRFSLFQEFLFSYLFLEFYYRYWKNLRQKLRAGDLVITDRYFYDLFGQYPYARNSWIIKVLLKMFPRPDVAYVLEANLTKILRRKKTDQRNLKVTAQKRVVLPREYLLQQQQNYHLLLSLLPLKSINTDKNPRRCAEQILKQTWREVL